MYTERTHGLEESTDQHNVKVILILRVDRNRNDGVEVIHKGKRRKGKESRA